MFEATLKNRAHPEAKGVTLALDELMRDDSVENYQQEQEANMESMAW